MGDSESSLFSFFFYVLFVYPATNWLLKPGRFSRTKGLTYAVSLLVAIALLDDALYFWIIPLYLVRTWVMNCTSGLTKSILNDYVSKKRRAKWNGLESVNIFSWSGSAALGAARMAAVVVD